MVELVPRVRHRHRVDHLAESRGAGLHIDDGERVGRRSIRAQQQSVGEVLRRRVHRELRRRVESRIRPHVHCRASCGSLRFLSAAIPSHPTESGGEKLPHGSGWVVRLRRREIGAPTGGFPSPLWTEGVGDEGCGSVCAGSARLPCGGDEPAAGGAGVRHRPEDGGEDAALFGAAGLPAQQAAGAPQARWVHRRHRPDPGGGPGAAAQAAAHGAAHLPAAAGRARLRRRRDDREGFRPGAAAAGPGDVRPPGASTRARAGRLRRGGGGGRRGGAEGPLLLPRPAALGRLLRQGLPGRDRGGVLRRAQRGVRLLRRRAAEHAVRQHAAGGGAHPRRRHPPAHAGVRRVAVAPPLRRPLRPAGQGQRQREGRGPGRLRPAQLPGAGAAGRGLRRPERPSRGALPVAPR